MRFLNSIIDSISRYETPGQKPWAMRSGLAVLYLFGLIWFGFFFNWGVFPLTFQDWAEISGPRLQFLKVAAKQLELPLHVSDASTLHNFTNRFLSVPDTIISPQVFLLHWLSIAQFSWVQVLLLYTLGFSGLLALRRRFRLSWISFAFLFILFNFNGHILAHLSIGHESWAGYFLYPWFAELIFRLLDGDHSWKWTFGMAGLVFVIWLQGSYHQVVYLLIFLAAVGVFIPRTFWVVIRTGFFALLISAFRLMPAALLPLDYAGGFFNGYPSLYALYDSFVSVYSPLTNSFFQAGLGNGISTWELTNYIGLLGAAFVLYFGVFRNLIHPQSRFARLRFPLLAMLVLSLGQIFDLVLQVPIPLIQGERISSRLFTVVLVFVLILAAEAFQRWLDENPRRFYFGALGLLALGLLVFDLWQNSNVWSVNIVQYVFPPALFNPQDFFVKNDPTDTIYFIMIAAGAVITLLTTAGLALISWREGKKGR